VSRQPEPPADDIVDRLQDSDNETVDVVALIGFVGPVREDGSGGHRRVYPDIEYQRWLAIPAGAIVDSVPASLGRTLIWVDGDVMRDDVFKDSVLEALDGQFAPGGGMSTWTLIPDSRYIAAEMLGLLAHSPAVERATTYEEPIAAPPSAG